MRFPALSMAGAAALALLTAVAPAQAEDKFTYMTNWYAQAEHGGFYQAQALGIYKKYGLDVTIKMGGPQVNITQMMAAGQADCIMGSSDIQMMQVREGGVPVVTVAAYFQKDPQVLIAHEDVKKFEDLKGKTLLIGAQAQRGYWPWLKAKYGFADDQIRKYTFNSAPFLADKRVAEEGYVSSEPYTLEKQAGLKPLVFLLADNGYPGYANMALAPDSLIAKNPAAVKAFVEATAQGWHDYLYGDPKPGDALIRKDNPEMTQDVLDQARDKMRTYGLVDSGDAKTAGIGVMTAARWKTFTDMAVSEGVYPKTFDPKRAYTLQFVGK